MTYNTISVQVIDALYGIRGKCVVKYNLNDLSYIKIYSMKGEFLCRADRVTATHDIKYWIENKTYPEKEIAIRFHHRLVQIHPFPNGNGRISRLMADLLMRKFGLPDLNWGSGDLTEISELRQQYIAALRKADRGDYVALISFVK